MQRFLRPFAALLFLSSLALAETEGRKPPETYLGPYVVVAPRDARLAALETLPPNAAPGPNAAGVLLEVPPPFGDESLRETVRLLVKNAHAAGRRAGLWISLPEVAAPASDRAAEAANAESLVPGLGRLLEASAGLDLVALALPEQSADDAGVAGRRFLVRKVAAEVRARSPKARIALVFAAGPDGLFAPATSRVLDEEIAAFVDVVGLTASPRISGEALRAAADALSFGRPLLVRVPSLDSPDALLALAGRLAAFGVPHVAAPLASKPETDIALDRLGRLLDDDAARDGRSVTATLTAGTPLPAFRVVAGVDLGGLVVVPATDAALAPARGPLSLALDAPSYARAEITELATGRSRAFDIPLTKEGPTLTLSTITGSLAVRLTAREKAPADATKAASGVSAVRGLTAEEILARHQTWRAARDARWSRLSARNQTTLNFRFANLTTTLDYTLSGPFFFEKGAGYDWLWQEAYFNGVKWKGKKVPELPLIQPEKVTEVPLALTFNDSYRYELEKEAVVDGVSCYVLRFAPREGSTEKVLYQGRVHVAKDDFALVRAETRQLGLSGEVQSVDEISEFTLVPATDGGPPMRFPTRTRGQWILKTFSRTTVFERDSQLSDVRLDPADFDTAKATAFSSDAVMVRDTEKGVRYLEKDKTGVRVVVEDKKTAQLYGAGGLFYDDSLDYPLPILGLYYYDFDFRKKKQQIQGLFGGVLVAASFNDPNAFGSSVSLGADVFGLFVRGSDAVFVNGEEDEAQRVKSLSFAGNFNAGISVGPHLRLGATLGVTRRDFAIDKEKTDATFALPSDHLVTRASAEAVYDRFGWVLSGRFQYNKRSKWEPWGYAGNPDYEPGKDTFQLYGATVAKDFSLPKFQRIRTSVSWLGSSNTDRFSKYSFGFFGGTSLRGFRSGSLRAEQAFVARAAYGLVFGSALRIEGVYDHAFVKDRATGLNYDSFGGAGLSGELPGPWTTLMRIDAGIPVVGRNKGQSGFVVNMLFLKIF